LPRQHVPVVRADLDRSIAVRHLHDGRMITPATQTCHLDRSSHLYGGEGWAGPWVAPDVLPISSGPTKTSVPCYTTPR